MLRVWAAAAGILVTMAVATLHDAGFHVAWGQAAKSTDTTKPALPDPNALAILIQTAVVAASQANRTGNYTVLHALGSPDFQKANSPEKLAQIFADWRKKNIDLTPVIIFSPVLKSQPAVTDQGMLRLTGYYKTQPQQVHFDLLFQPVAGQWRLFGIAMSTQPAPPEAAAAPPAEKKAAGPPTEKKAPPSAKK